MEKSKKPKIPNELLRYEREKRGWSQSKLAELIEADTSMISRWECGERKPEPVFQEKLCHLFDKNAEELGFIKSAAHNTTSKQKRPLTREKRNTEDRDTANVDHFLFGDLQTTWVVVDGDGIGKYLPRDTRSYFDPHPAELPQDLQEKKRQIEQQQTLNRQQGLPFQWNGERYSLDRFILSRDGDAENLALDLWFKPSDYYTFLNYRRTGVRDKFENAQMHAVKFELDTIIPFVFQHTFWAPGGLACLYHALVHKFGRSRVEEFIEQYLVETT